MADHTEGNVSSSNDENTVKNKTIEHAAAVGQRLVDRTPNSKYNEDKSKLSLEGTEGFEENWEKEIEKIPAFMTHIPSDIETSENSLLQALQAIKYAEDDTPKELAVTHKEDGNQWFKKRKYKLAITAYGEALKQSFDEPELRAVLYTNQAAANFHLGNFGSALKKATEAVKHNPSHLKALIRGAECCMKLERYGQAVMWCDKALRIAADDKRVLELRSQSAKQQKILDRDDRKKKLKDKAAQTKKIAIVEAIQSRHIQFAQFKDDSRNPDTEIRGPKTQERLIMEAVLSGHPSGAVIVLDESGNLTWPVTFLYPEHSQSDFIEAFHEHSTFQGHLEVMFQDYVPWDTAKLYRQGNLEVYFHHSEAKQLVQVSSTQSLGETLRDTRYLVAKEPIFVILCKASAFRNSYLKRYTNLF